MTEKKKCFSFFPTQDWILNFSSRLILAYEVVEESTCDTLGEHKKGFGGIGKE